LQLITFIQSDSSIQRLQKLVHISERTQQKSYLQGCKANHFGYGTNSSISKKI